MLLDKYAYHLNVSSIYFDMCNIKKAFFIFSFMSIWFALMPSNVKLFAGINTDLIEFEITYFYILSELISFYRLINIISSAW